MKTPTYALIIRIIAVNLALTACGLMKAFDPTPTPTPPPAATPTVTQNSNNPSAAVLPVPDASYTSYLTENFNDDSNDWSTGNVDGDYWVGTRLVQNGVLDWDGFSRIGMFSDITPGNPAYLDTLTDVTVSSKVKLVNPTMNGYYGITVRAFDKNDEANFYAFVLDAKGNYAFWLYTNSKYKTLIDWKPDNANPGNWNTMTIQAVGSHFRLFLNNKLLSETDDSSLSSGHSGVIVGANDSGAKLQVQHDDFQVLVPPPSATSGLPTGSPTGAMGSLKGKMISKASGNQISGAGIVLCRSAESSCTADTNLMATTGTKGEFEIQAIPAGNYVILYNPSGISGESIANLSLDINDKSVECIAQGFLGSLPADCSGSVPFSDDPHITLAKGSKLGISATGTSLNDGSISSIKYGLSLNFENGKAQNIEIKSGETGEIVVTVWDEK